VAEGFAPLDLVGWLGFWLGCDLGVLLGCGVGLGGADGSGPSICAQNAGTRSIPPAAWISAWRWLGSIPLPGLPFAARHAWHAGHFTDDYRRWRPMVERSIAWLVADNHRRVRYRGVPKNQLGLSLRIAALNLRRLVNLGLNHNGNAWALA